VWQGGPHHPSLLQEVRRVVHQTTSEVGLLRDYLVWCGHKLVYGYRCYEPHH
jgi:hypothetical protein